MSASKVVAPRGRIRFRAEAAIKIAEQRGATRQMDHAHFYGISESSWSRIVREERQPGEEFIAAVLASHPGDPEINFDALFEVVPA